MSGFGSQALHPWPVAAICNMFFRFAVAESEKRNTSHYLGNRGTPPPLARILCASSCANRTQGLDQKLDQGVAVKLEELPSVNAQVPVKLEVGEEPLSTEGGNGKRTIEQVGHSEQSSQQKA